MNWIEELGAAQQEALKQTERVLKEVRAERARQFAEWGWQQNETDYVAQGHDDTHLPGDWTRFLVRHVGRAEQAIEDDDRWRWREQMIRVAAIAVAAVESQDRVGPTR